MRRTASLLATLLTAAVCAAGAAGPVQAVVPVPDLVAADVETVPVTHSGDAADDPAIWVSPLDPAESLLIGNDKLGALETYNLDGSLQQRITRGTTKWGNVDVRQRVDIDGQTVDVVAAYNGGLALFDVDATTRRLTTLSDSSSGVLATGGGEGLCLYQSRASGDLSAFVITYAGLLRQFVLSDNDGDGLLEATKVRELNIGSESEGCVADDETGALYVAQEDVALWRYGAEPADGGTRTAIDHVQPDGHLSADIEGVTLVRTAGGGGYLIASAQNVANFRQNYYTVYDRRTNAYIKSFRIVPGPAADGCEKTDGITAYAGDLGPRFPYGMFVCQDTNNAAPGVGNQDFKMVRLEKVVDLDTGGTNTPPTAAFSATCSQLDCSFDATASADPDGSVVGYDWDFGDGSSSSGITTHHRYADEAQRTVTLTVTDNRSASTSTSRQVDPQASSVAFRAAASSNTNTVSHSVRIPTSAQAGDTLLLVFMGNRSDRTITGPTGWTAIQQVAVNGAVARVWTRTAVGADAGATVSVRASGQIQADLTVAAYGHVAAVASAQATDQKRSVHVSPAISVGSAGAWVATYWADKSPSATMWTLPPSQLTRTSSSGRGTGHITAAFSDFGSMQPPGRAGGLSGTTGVTGSQAIMFTFTLSAA